MSDVTPIKPLHLDDVAECSPKAKQQLRDLRTALEQAERERDEARALLRAIYRGKWVGPRMRETIEAVVSPRYLRGESDERDRRYRKLRGLRL